MLLTINEWMEKTYSPEGRPHMNTVLRWIQMGFIYPQPVKQGKRYYIEEDAKYTPFKSRRVIV